MENEILIASYPVLRLKEQTSPIGISVAHAEKSKQWYSMLMSKQEIAEVCALTLRAY